MSTCIQRRRLLPALAALALLGGCASTAQIDVQRAPDIDVSSARTYGWVEELGTDRAEYEAMITTRLKRFVGEALDAKGLRYDADAPDVLVNFYVNLESRQEVITTPTPISSGPVVGPAGRIRYYHGFRTGLYDPWPDYTVETREYQEGTLTIDVVDAEASRLAWEAVAVGRVRRETAEQRDELLAQTIEAMFAQFP